MYFCIIKYMYVCMGVSYMCLCIFICEYRSLAKYRNSKIIIEILTHRM